jgi:ribosomal protein S18 acetylase RimI-like enzyme
VNISLKSHVPHEQMILREFLYYAIYVQPGGNPPDPSVIEDPHLAPYYQNWGQKDDRALFAFLKQKVIGVCWSRCFLKESPGYGTIHPNVPELAIAVLPNYRGMGVGTKLLRAFFGLLQKDYSAVSLSVDAKNPALGLYERFGFLKFSTKGGSLIMIKELDKVNLGNQAIKAKITRSHTLGENNG